MAPLKAFRMPVFFLCMSRMLLLAACIGGSTTAPAQNSSPPISLGSSHSGSIAALAFSGDGQWLATGGEDHAIKIWNVQQFRVVKTLLGHSGKLTALAFSPDNDTLASAGADGSILLWSAGKNWAKRPLSSGSMPVESLVFTPDGKYLIAGQLDGQVKVRDENSGNELATIQEHGSIQFLAMSASNPHLLAIGTEAIGGNSANTAHIWDFESKRELHDFAGSSEMLAGLALSPDGSVLVAATRKDGCKLWDVASGSLIRTLGSETAAIAFDGQGHLLELEPLELREWDVSDGTSVGSWPVAASSTFLMAVSASRDVVALGESFFDLKAKREIPAVSRAIDQVLSIDVSAGGLLAASIGNLVEIFDLSRSSMHVLKEETQSEVMNLKFSPDGHSLVTWGDSLTFQVWDADRGNLLWTSTPSKGPVNDVVYSSDGRMLASASDDAVVRLWDLKTHHITKSFAAFLKSAKSVAFTPNSREVVASGKEVGDDAQDFDDISAVKGWDVQTGRQLHHFTDQGLNSLGEHLRISLDSRSLISVHNGIRVQDLETGRTLHNFGEDLGLASDIHIVTPTDTSQVFAASGETHEVSKWDVRHGAKIKSFPANAKGFFGGIALNAAQGWLATVSVDGTILIWDESTAKKIATLASFENGDKWLLLTSDYGFNGSPSIESQLSLDGPVKSEQDRLTQLVTLRNTSAGSQELNNLAPRQVSSTSLSIDVRMPIVSITPLGQDATHPVSVQELTLRVHIDSISAQDDLKEIELSQDGSVARVWTGDLPMAAKGQLDLEQAVSLREGRNHFTASALTLSGKRSLIARLEITADRAPPAIFIQAGRARAVRDVCFSPIEDLLAAGRDDGALVIWDPVSGRELRRLRGHNRAINSVAFSPNGESLVSGSADHTAILWDVATGRRLRTFASHSAPIVSLAFSPDGQLLATGSADHTIGVWNIQTGRETASLVGHVQTVLSVAFNPVSSELASSSIDGTIRIWRLNDPRHPRVLRDKSSRDVVSSLAFDSQGRTLIAGERFGSLVFWDLDTGKVKRSVRRGEDTEAPENEKPFLLDGLTFSPNNHYVVASDGLLYSDDLGVWVGANDVRGSLRFFDPNSGLEAFRLQGQLGEAFKGTSFSRNGKYIATGSSDGSVQIWDVKTQQEKASLSGANAEANSLALGSRNKKLAVGGRGIRIWDLQTGDAGKSFGLTDQGVEDVVFGSDDDHVVSSESGGKVRLWTLVPEPKSIVVTVGKGSGLFGISDYTALAYAKRKQLLAFVHDAGKNPGITGATEIQVWNTEHRKATMSLGGESRGELLHTVDFNSEGTSAVAAADSVLTLWDMQSGKEQRSIATGETRISCAIFANDDKTVAVGGTKGISLWDVQSGTRLAQKFDDATDVSVLRFSPDGALIASGHLDGAIRIWDTASGDLVHTLAGHDEGISDLAFIPSTGSGGTNLISSSYDGTMRVWSAPSGEHLATLLNIGSTDWLVVTPTGLFDGSPPAWKQVQWRFGVSIHDVAPVEIFFNEYYHPGLLGDILAGLRPKPDQSAAIAEIDRRQPSVQLVLKPGGLSGGQGRTALVQVGATEAPPGADQATGKTFPHGSGVQDIRLFRNGSLVKVWHGLQKTDSKGAVSVETEVKLLAGQNVFTAYAFSAGNIKSEDASLETAGSHFTAPASTLYILAAGVNHYANPNFDLRYAVNDAEDISGELHARQAKLSTYNRVVEVVLRDEQVTKTNLLWALAKLSGKETGALPKKPPAGFADLRPAEPEDGVVLYFAGHGMAKEPRFYLIPYDLGYEGESSRLSESSQAIIFEHSISDLELAEALEGIEASQLLLIIDSCRSGQALLAGDRRPGPMNSKGLAQLAYDKGMYIMTASQEYQAAKETTQYEHGLLTYALVDEGLKQFKADRDPKDGKILLREWLDYATGAVPLLEGGLAASRGTHMEDLQTRSNDDNFLQHPRVFYRRELDITPFVVALEK
jgi:WD40 repeat protein